MASVAAATTHSRNEPERSCGTFVTCRLDMWSLRRFEDDVSWLGLVSCGVRLLLVGLQIQGTWYDHKVLEP